jgi:hypothetical protein
MAGHSFGGATAVAACARAVSAARMIARGAAAASDDVSSLQQEREQEQELQVPPGFSGFSCGLILDGWMWPIVGDSEDTEEIDRAFGGGGESRTRGGSNSNSNSNSSSSSSFGASTATPLLFVDAESFASDRRWWSCKADLVRRCSAAGSSSSALVSLRHSVHYTCSDVLVLGGYGFSLLNRLRAKPTNLKRGGLSEESEGGVGPGHEEADSSRPEPTAEELLNEALALTSGFVASHRTEEGVAASSRPHERATSSWASRLHNPSVYRVFASAPELAVPQDAPAAPAKL